MINQMPGQFGDYRLIRLLGSGRFAKVYLAENTLLGNARVALKLLHQMIDIELLHKEATILQGLRHENIVHIRYFGVEKCIDSDQKEKFISFLAMDYAPGGTIYDYYSQRIPLSPDEVVPFLRQIAGALQYAHDHQVIHRDIKPHNILIGEHNKLLLSDFGIALIAENLPTQQNFAGTSLYMAPEQIRQKSCFASDQYALGVVVYEWLCGKCPFVDTSTYKIMRDHLNTPPPSLCQRNPNISPAVEIVVMKALAKNPGDRHSSVQKFVEAFEAACQPDAQPSLIDKLSVKFGRRKIFTGVALATAVVLAGAGSATYELTHLPQANFTYNGHTDRVITVAWSPDGKSIASGGHDKVIRVWDAHSGTDIVAYNEPPSIAIYSVAWSPNGKEIASGSEYGEARVWEVSMQYVVSTYKIHTASVNTLAWSPDGKLIASGSRDTTVQVWDATTGRNVLTYHGHSADVWAVAWSPDGKLIASGGDDGTLQVWDTTTGKTNFTYLGHRNFQLRAVEWSPDGKLIASGGTDRLVQVWNPGSKSPPYAYGGHSETVEGLTWSPDGTRIASASDDKTVQVWQIPQSM